jgi:hypothetical protein
MDIHGDFFTKEAREKLIPNTLHDVTPQEPTISLITATIILKLTSG